ncbi:MAG: glutamine synthetase family protein [Hyphomicrobiaceae bacterium]
MSSNPSSDLRSGLLAPSGFLTQSAIAEADNVLQQVEANGLETIRIVFPDPHGILRGKTIVASALASALTSGITVPSTVLLKDTSQRTAFPIWNRNAGFGHGALIGSGDVLLAPDPTTFRVLPWSPKTGWLLCDVANRDGSPISFAPRTVLRSALGQLEKAGFALVAGLEVEFHVFKIAEPRDTPIDAGMPAAPPEVSFLTRNYELLGEARYDALEDTMDLLRKHCTALGLPVRAMEAEFGPSQLEFVFDPGEPLAQADSMVLLRSMVKQVCARKGLHATFMCRPKFDACAASGWHLHQSIIERGSGENVFVPASDGTLRPTAGAWIAGLLAHARETCLLTTPTINGYRRYQAHQLAPNRIQWAHDNRGAMIRALVQPGDNSSRIENRVAEPAANPYYVLASQIVGGLDGVQRKLTPPEPVETPYDAAAPSLPNNMLEALEAFQNGNLFREALGEDFVEFYGHLKRAEWDRYIATISDWEQHEYFSLF